MDFNVFDAIVLSITLILAIKGFFNGIIKEVAGLLGIVLGVYLGSTYYVEAGKYINESVFKIPNESAINVVGFVSIFVVTWLVITLIGMLFAKILSVSKLTLLDKIGGVIFSAGKFFVIVSIIVTMLSQIEILQKNIDKLSKNSLVYPIMLKIGNQLVNLKTDEIQQQIDDVKKKVQEKLGDSFKEKIEKTKETIANGISDNIKPQIDKAIEDAINKNKGE
jgi:membrane protein required for colicin V production